MMIILKVIVKQYGFMCLLYEKLFVGVNGLGKYVNWFVGNVIQGNLFDFGNMLNENLNFLLFCGVVICGVYIYGLLLWVVIVIVFNDYWLGVNEVLFVIILVYLGDQFEKLFLDIKEGKFEVIVSGGLMDLGLDQILKFECDLGDCN